MAGQKAQIEVERATELRRVYHGAGVYVQPKDHLVDQAMREAASWAHVAQEREGGVHPLEVQIASTNEKFVGYEVLSSAKSSCQSSMPRP